MNVNVLLNNYLNGQRIPKHEYTDLKIIARVIEEEKRTHKLKKILGWFRYLHKIETIGWRNTATTRKITRILLKNSPEYKLLLFALFCPSYKKGAAAFGFRTDSVGNTTLSGIKNLKNMQIRTKQLGFYCEKPLAIFFDLAIEQPDKVLAKNGLKDLEQNILNFKKHLPKDIKFIKLSILNKKLFTMIGYEGVSSEVPLIPQKIFNRILERGRKFYKHFGWSERQIIERTSIIGTSEAVVGSFLKKKYPRGIMVYTPTMLERAFVYSGMDLNKDPLPVIFPKKPKGS